MPSETWRHNARAILKEPAQAPAHFGATPAETQPVYRCILSAPLESLERPSIFDGILLDTASGLL